jgi:hypothetical protein
MWEFEATVDLPRRPELKTEDPQGLAEVPTRIQPDWIGLRYRQQPPEGSLIGTSITVSTRHTSGVTTSVHARSEHEANSRMLTVTDSLRPGTSRSPWRTRLWPLGVVAFLVSLLVNLLMSALTELSTGDVAFVAWLISLLIIYPLFGVRGWIMPALELHGGRTRLTRTAVFAGKAAGALATLAGLILAVLALRS